MVDDLVSYAARVQKALGTLHPERQDAMVIDPQLAPGAKEFLSALAGPAKDGADKNILIYTIISDNTAGLTINGKSMSDVMALYREFLLPAINHHPPAKGPSGNPQ